MTAKALVEDDSFGPYATPLALEVIRKAVWMQHAEERGAECRAAEILAFGDRCSEMVRAVLLPALTPRLRAQALADALAELDWWIDGDYIVDRYLIGIPVFEKKHRDSFERAELFRRTLESFGTPTSQRTGGYQYTCLTKCGSITQSWAKAAGKGGKRHKWLRMRPESALLSLSYRRSTNPPRIDQPYSIMLLGWAFPLALQGSGSRS